jgi:hypothetical protein
MGSTLSNLFATASEEPLTSDKLATLLDYHQSKQHGSAYHETTYKSLVDARAKIYKHRESALKAKLKLKETATHMREYLVSNSHCREFIVELEALLEKHNIEDDAVLTNVNSLMMKTSQAKSVWQKIKKELVKDNDLIETHWDRLDEADRLRLGRGSLRFKFPVDMACSNYMLDDEAQDLPPLVAERHAERTGKGKSKSLRRAKSTASLFSDDDE